MRLERRLVLTAVILGTSVPATLAGQEPVEQRQAPDAAQGAGGQARPRGAGAENVRRKKGEKKDGDLPSDAQKAATPGQQFPVRAKLIELIQQKHARAERQVRRARTFLNEGKLDEADAALEAARHSQKEAWYGLRLVEKLAFRLKGYLSLIEDLSVIKVRIVSARPSFPEEDDPTFRVSALLTDLFFPGWRLNQDIGAQILETHTVGSRFASRTVMGKRFPSRKRRDLQRGRSLELSNDAIDTGVGQLKEGQEYWLAVTPPIALKAIPRQVGRMGKTRIVFAMRARKRRRL